MRLTKKKTVYFDADIHKKVKHRAEVNSASFSEIINDILSDEFQDEVSDLRYFRERLSEPVISYENLISELKKNGKL